MTGSAALDDPLNRLLEGNRRFAAGKSLHPHSDPGRRTSLLKGQEPFAMILGCADSRVPPELIFDCGLGGLFVVRSAAQTIDQAVLATLSFGWLQLHVPLLVVLGHQDCGAVKAALTLKMESADPPSAIRFLVDAINPVLGSDESALGDSLVDHAVKAHIRRTVHLLRQSAAMFEPVGGRALRIVGAFYSLDTGLVELTVP